MNDEGGGRSSKPWNFYPSLGASSTAAMSPSQTEDAHRGETTWQSFGSASMNAISFGFVATAILISMFLIIAILEHLFRPNLSSSSQDGFDGGLESGSAAKFRNQNVVMTPSASGLSVVMPGQKYPTCIAQPAPLTPFPREGIRHPPHQHLFPLSQNQL